MQDIASVKSRETELETLVTELRHQLAEGTARETGGAVLRAGWHPWRSSGPSIKLYCCCLLASNFPLHTYCCFRCLLAGDEVKSKTETQTGKYKTLLLKVKKELAEQKSQLEDQQTSFARAQREVK